MQYVCVCVWGDNLTLEKSLRVLTAFLKLSESHTDACIRFSDYKRNVDALFMWHLPTVSSALLWKLIWRRVYLKKKKRFQHKIVMELKQFKFFLSSKFLHYIIVIAIMYILKQLLHLYLVEFNSVEFNSFYFVFIRSIKGIMTHRI